MSEITESKITDSKLQYRIELFLALIITGIVCAAGSSNLLFASNDLYPYTSDVMGHMAKVRYLSDCLLKGDFPSWFPYWHNGSTFTQYYPPLSYWIMALIYIPVQNVMLTFKIYCYLMFFIGGMGIWYFCRSFIGGWCGIFGAVVFCLQPYILRALYSAGTVAQGPIIALSSWYLFFLLSYVYRPDAKKFLLCTLICALMILGHPNTAFMMCLCIMAIFFVFAMIKRISLTNFTCVSLTIVFAGIITAFWSIVGVTELETPGISYLLVEAALIYTADITWYTTLSGTFFYFAIPVTIGSLISLFVYSYRSSTKTSEIWEKDYILYCILISFFTIVFSFGLNLPLFEYLPLAESYVPGRILGLTSVSGAILCAYLVYMIQKSAKGKKLSSRAANYILSTAIIGLTLYYMNPFTIEYSTITSYAFDEMIAKTNVEGSNFEKGRYAYMGVVDSSETFFPITYDLNLTGGWNIEGTPHNRAFWNHNIAYPTGCFSYIAKNLAFWNTKYLLFEERFDKITEELNKEYTFQHVSDKGYHKFYTSQLSSSYFLTDNRNGLIFGIGAPGVAMEFPYLVYEQRRDISDYSLAELAKYKLIYLCEPVADTMRQKERIEETIKYLAEKGVRIIIEPMSTKRFKLFDVAVSDVPAEDSLLLLEKQYMSPLNSMTDNIKIDEKQGYFRALFGIDEAYYKLVQNGGLLQNDIIGTKRVGKGEVLFLGMHLSQYLKAVYALNLGVPEDIKEYPSCSDEIKALFGDIFKTYGVEQDFWPEPFPVNNASWNYKGVDFDYSSQAAQEMTISITYTPRWKATIDGKPSDVGQRENLITLQLPAGGHKVQLKYGLTKYAVIGYTTLITGLLLLFLFTRYYDINISNLRKLYIFFKKYFQV